MLSGTTLSAPAVAGAFLVGAIAAAYLSESCTESITLHECRNLRGPRVHARSRHPPAHPGIPPPPEVRHRAASGLHLRWSVHLRPTRKRAYPTSQPPPWGRFLFIFALIEGPAPRLDLPGRRGG